jgi:hypothetical protein
VILLDRPPSSESNLSNLKSPKNGTLSPEANNNNNKNSHGSTSPSSLNASNSKLSSSFSASNNTQMYNAFISSSSNGGGSSKPKPFAPRAKFSATLGAASGAEVLKQIHTFESNTIGSGVAAGIKKELLASEQKREAAAAAADGSLSSVNSNSGTAAVSVQPAEREGSIARIIRADSLQNLTNRVLPSLASSNLVIPPASTSGSQATSVSNIRIEQPTNSSTTNLANTRYVVKILFHSLHRITPKF